MVIAGTRHDMIMLGVGINKNYFTCDITSTCPVIHQNHGYNYISKQNLTILKTNNYNCAGNQRWIHESPFKIQECKGMEFICNSKSFLKRSFTKMQEKK